MLCCTIRQHLPRTIKNNADSMPLWHSTCIVFKQTIITSDMEGGDYKWLFEEKVTRSL